MDVGPHLRIPEGDTAVRQICLLDVPAVFSFVTMASGSSERNGVHEVSLPPRRRAENEVRCTPSPTAFTLLEYAKPKGFIQSQVF